MLDRKKQSDLARIQILKSWKEKELLDKCPQPVSSVLYLSKVMGPVTSAWSQCRDVCSSLVNHTISPPKSKLHTFDSIAVSISACHPQDRL